MEWIHCCLPESRMPVGAPACNLGPKNRRFALDDGQRGVALDRTQPQKVWVWTFVVGVAVRCLAGLRAPTRAAVLVAHQVASVL